MFRAHIVYFHQLIIVGRALTGVDPYDVISFENRTLSVGAPSLPKTRAAKYWLYAYFVLFVVQMARRGLDSWQESALVGKPDLAPILGVSDRALVHIVTSCALLY